MNFNEAMEKLKEGKKISRNIWKDTLYYQLKGSEIKTYQNKLDVFIYDEDIMLSNGWLLIGDTKEYSFVDLLPLLYKGAKATHKEWEKSYFYLELVTKTLIISTIYEQSFVPDFMSFLADDWIEL